jgi:hypothetical protein
MMVFGTGSISLTIRKRNWQMPLLNLADHRNHNSSNSLKLTILPHHHNSNSNWENHSIIMASMVLYMMLFSQPQRALSERLKLKLLPCLLRTSNQHPSLSQKRPEPSHLLLMSELRNSSRKLLTRYQNLKYGKTIMITLKSMPLLVDLIGINLRLERALTSFSDLPLMKKNT